MQPTTNDAKTPFDLGHAAAIAHRGHEDSESAKAMLLGWLPKHQPELWREFWRGYYYPWDDVPDDAETDGA